MKWVLLPVRKNMRQNLSNLIVFLKPLPRALIKKNWDAEQLELLHSVDGKAEWHDHFGKVWQFHIRLSTHLPYHLVIPRLGIHPREEKRYVHTETYM